VLFDNSLNDKRFRIDIRMENGYEEGCTRGAFFCYFRNLGQRSFAMYILYVLYSPTIRKFCIGNTSNLRSV